MNRAVTPELTVVLGIGTERIHGGLRKALISRRCLRNAGSLGTGPPKHTFINTHLTSFCYSPFVNMEFLGSQEKTYTHDKILSLCFFYYIQSQRRGRELELWGCSIVGDSYHLDSPSTSVN